MLATAQKVQPVTPKDILEIPHRLWAKPITFADVMTGHPDRRTLTIRDKTYYRFYTEELGEAYCEPELVAVLEKLPLKTEYIFGGTVLSRKGDYFAIVDKVVQSVDPTRDIEQQIEKVIGTPQELKDHERSKQFADTIQSAQQNLVMYAQRNGIPYKELFDAQSTHHLNREGLIRNAVESMERDQGISAVELVSYLVDQILQEKLDPQSPEASVIRPVPTPTAAPSSIPAFLATPTPLPRVVPTPAPTPTTIPMLVATPLPTPVVEPTPIVVPTPAVFVIPTPLPTPTAIPVPTATPQPTPVPTAIPVPTPVPTALPTPTPLPLPTATPVPTPTATPRPTPTATPRPTPTATPRPTATPLPTPTATPRPAPTATPAQQGGYDAKLDFEFKYAPVVTSGTPTPRPVRISPTPLPTYTPTPRPVFTPIPRPTLMSLRPKSAATAPPQDPVQGTRYDPAVDFEFKYIPPPAK